MNLRKPDPEKLREMLGEEAVRRQPDPVIPRLLLGTARGSQGKKCGCPRLHEIGLSAAS
jgi:hypothetical protein